MKGPLTSVSYINVNLSPYRGGGGGRRGVAGRKQGRGEGKWTETELHLAGPGTVRGWEETGIAESIGESISRRLSSFPGLLDLCAESLFAWLMLAVTQSLNLLRDLPCFRFPEASSPNISCFGSLLSPMRMTCPSQRSRLFRIMASMLVDSAMSRTCVLETRSCHLMFRMVCRLSRALADLVDPGADLFVETPFNADHAAEVFKVVDQLQLGAIN